MNSFPCGVVHPFMRRFDYPIQRRTGGLSLFERLAGDVDQRRTVVGDGLAQDAFQLVRIGHAPGLHTEAGGNGRMVTALEVDIVVAGVAVVALAGLDPSEA